MTRAVGVASHAARAARMRLTTRRWTVAATALLGAIARVRAPFKAVRAG